MFNVVSIDSNVFIDLDLNCNGESNTKNSLSKNENNGIINEFRIDASLVDDSLVIDTDTEIDFSMNVLKFFNFDFDANINFDVIFDFDDFFFDIIFDVMSSVTFNNDIKFIIFFDLDLYDKNDNGSMFEFNYEIQRIDSLL